MDAAKAAGRSASDAVSVTNADGAGPCVIVCDHASNHLPPQFGTLGLPPADLERHIAWDPGALPVARTLSKLLEAPLVESRISRLVIDCNRPLDAPDLIWEVSETTHIPGNVGLDDAERARRIALAYEPYHAAIDAVLERRGRIGQASALISVHSFNPVYRGVGRPWHVGILHDDDTRLSTPLIAALARQDGLVVGDNQPYSPADRVYFTLERHARSRGLPCVMVEIRNDEIATEKAQEAWALRLAEPLAALCRQFARTMKGTDAA